MITLIKGDNETISVVFTDQNGDAIDITGYTVFFTVKSKDVLTETDDTNAIIKKDITNHSDPTKGETNIVLTTADTTIAVGIYLWDLQLKSQAGIITSTTRDELEVVQDITRRTT